MPIQKVSFEETLERFVLPTNCIGCASCVIVCPFNCLEYVDMKPRLIKECQLCGICPQVCPKYNLDMPSLERLIFGRERRDGEDFGIYRRIVIAQTTNDDILNICQDGGVVTTLLVYALEEGLIDGAVLSGVSKEEPLKPIPKLATTVKEILECAGTRYTYSPNIVAFKEGILQKRSLAFVGTPCQINALRRIQMIPLKKYADALNFTIGLFCSESFTYEGFVLKQLRGKLGIDPREVEKVNIKGKMIITTRSGEVRTISLKEVKEYATSSCASCRDFSSELADISVGGLGLNQWTLTILRTEKGEELFRKAEAEGLLRTRSVEEEKGVLDLLVKISRRKRESA